MLCNGWWENTAWFLHSSNPVVRVEMTNLYQLGCALRAAVAMVVPIDGQHPVILLQLPITGSHATFQQVENKHPWLIGLADQLYSQLLIWAALVQHNMEAVIPVAVSIKGKSAVPAPVPLLSEHRQSEHVAGLLQDWQGIVVRHIFDVHAIYLEERSVNQEQKDGLFWVGRRADLYTQMSSYEVTCYFKLCHTGGQVCGAEQSSPQGKDALHRQFLSFFLPLSLW